MEENHKSNVLSEPSEIKLNKVEPPFVVRLLKETREYAQAMNKLNTFMASYAFLELTQCNKDFLYEEQRAMSTLLQIKGKRLSLLVEQGFSHKDIDSSKNPTIEEMVVDWRRKFKLVVNDDKPFLENLNNLSMKQMDLDIGLIDEEIGELRQALIDDDPIEVLDAIGDIQFVLGQLYCRLGLSAEDIRLISAEVYKSNMTKGCRTIEDVEDTVDAYKTEGYDSIIDDDDPQFMLVYQHGGKKSGKLLKNVNEFVEPDFTSLLETLNK